MIKKIPSLTLIILLTYFLSYLSHSATIDESLNNYLAPISNFVAGIVFYSFNIGEYSFPLIVVWLIRMKCTS